MLAGAAAPPKTPTPAPAPRVSPEDAEFFEKSIRPLLAENCFGCHSSAVKKPMGGLRLDSRAGLLRGGERGPALVPGDVERSLITQAVGYQEPRLQMPPKEKLPAEKVALIVEWVKRGAPWPSGADMKAPAAGPAANDWPAVFRARRLHWAFQPLRQSPLPKVRRKDWARTSVDNFILAALEARGLTPAKPAGRRTLIRRVTFDLTGLPPTPAEVEAFVNDRSPGAYRNVVDRLLASPHYGERWARHWLDLVRFAETDGHEYDFEKPGAYRYRDYVIRAFNADVPYDRFVMEHLAGDLLATPRLNPEDRFDESVLGTGFLWLGEGKHSPVDLLEDEAERVDNQIDVLGKTFVGLTLGCARCHDHKFDAISTKDYYSLAGILKSTRYQVVRTPPAHLVRQQIEDLSRTDAELLPDVKQRVAAGLRARVEDLGRALLASGDAAPAGETILGKAVLDSPLANQPASPLHPWKALAGSRDGEFVPARKGLAAQLKAQSEAARQALAQTTLFEGFDRIAFAPWTHSGEAFGNGPSRAPVRPAPEARWALEAVPASGVAHSGVVSERLSGALRSGDFRITRPRIHFRMAGGDSKINLIIDGFQRIRAPLYGGLEIAPAQGGPFRWYTMDVSRWIGHRAYIELLDPGTGFIAVDEIRFGDAASLPEPPNPLIVALLEDPTVTSAADLARRYQELFARTVDEWSAGRLDSSPDRRPRLALLDGLLRHVPPPSTADWSGDGGPMKQRFALDRDVAMGEVAMAATEGSGFDDRVHLRGSTRTLGEVAPRRFLEAVAGPRQPAPRAGSGRLELARRMTDPSNPLLPRVMVNRLWQHHFGEGIVRTPDDFGIRGERPTHPELLDFLAREFVKGGWSLKKMHRTMVLSSTYQMDSRGDARADAADPENRLLHRMPVRRLEAEAIRDGILAVSGGLNRTLYGPGPLPHLTPFMEGRGRPASSGPLDGSGRRSIYISVRRNFLTPMFQAFDYPTPFATVGRRSVSTVPAQALTLMNNPFVVQQAGYWARRVLAEKSLSPAGRIERMYAMAFARPPAKDELEAALAFVREQDRVYATPDDPRSWGDLGHVLMNLKEFIFIQ